MKSILSLLFLCVSATFAIAQTNTTIHSSDTAKHVLKEVVIKGQQAIIRQKADRSIIVVNGAVLKLADNAMQLITLAPGITITDNEDAVQLSGKDGVEVMINNKLVKLSGRDLLKLLKSMPAGSVSQVEIMPNPSAKYDVTGNTGLLNIITKSNELTGFNGNVDLETSQSIHNMSDLSSTFNYGSDRLALTAYLGYHSGNYPTQYTEERQLENGFLHQQNHADERWSDPVFRLSGDYFLDSKQTISALIEQERSNNHGGYLTNSATPDSSYTTTSVNPHKTQWDTYNLSYRFADTSGTEFIVELNDAQFHKNDENDLTDKYFYSNTTDNTIYQTLTDIDLLTLKGDFTRNWKSKLKLEAGFKISRVNTQNSFTAVTSASSQDNNYTYHENVNALYLNLNRSFGRWGLQVGARLEQSHVKGIATDASGNPTVQPDSSYFNLLPAIYLTYQPSDKNNFRLSLNERLKRPNYSDLQPFSYQIDPTDEQVGDPSLRVQRNYNAELAYTYNDRLTLTTDYTHTVDFFTPVTYLVNNIYFQTVQNTGTTDNLNFNLNYPVRVFKWWNMLNKATVFENRFAGQLYEGYLDVAKWSYYLSTSQRFNIPGSVLLTLSARYNSPSQTLIYYSGDNSSVGISLSKKVLKGQGTIRLGFSDLFKGQRNNVIVNFEDLNYTQRNTWESQRGFVEFNWQFGSKKLKQHENRDNANAEEKDRSGG